MASVKQPQEHREEGRRQHPEGEGGVTGPPKKNLDNLYRKMFPRRILHLSFTAIGRILNTSNWSKASTSSSMSPTSTALTTKVESGSPYQLSSEQVGARQNCLNFALSDIFIDLKGFESSPNSRQIFLELSAFRQEIITYFNQFRGQGGHHRFPCYLACSYHQKTHRRY